MSNILPSISFQLGVGGVGGFLVGYALKKFSKLVAIMIGLFVLVLLYLSTQGVISLNFEGLMTSMTNLLVWFGSAFSWLVNVVSLLPFAGSFTAGLLLGLKFG